MVIKSEGNTPSEKYLAMLCEKSFLSLWSYPNPFTDNNPNHAELCDLLVVFGKDIIIFSVKSCDFQNTGDLNTDWKRWCKRAILESAKQIYGAEKWIKNHPNKVFLDKEVSHPCVFRRHWTVIPDFNGHPFRNLVDSDSGVWWTPIGAKRRPPFFDFFRKYYISSSRPCGNVGNS